MESPYDQWTDVTWVGPDTVLSNRRASGEVDPPTRMEYDPETGVLRGVRNGAPIEIGDIFIEPAGGGAFGHAVMVMDAVESAAGERLFLLSQSYMPAQESHILKNLDEPDLSPWYHIDPAQELRTPEWTFPAGSLRRFAEKGCP